MRVNKKLSVAFGLLATLLLVGPRVEAAQTTPQVNQEAAVLDAVGRYLRSRFQGVVGLDTRRPCELREECSLGRPHGRRWENRPVSETEGLARSLGDVRLGTWGAFLDCSAGGCAFKGVGHVVAFGAVTIDGDEARIRVFTASPSSTNSRVIPIDEWDATLVLKSNRGGHWTVVDEEMVRVSD